jgi:hypothetical protein
MILVSIHKYIVNNDNVCESIQTLEGGKYRNYIPYDPLAIICILGSKLESNVINQGVPGNYYHTIQNIKSADVDVDINTEVRDKILASLGNKKYRDKYKNDEEYCLKIRLKDKNKGGI